MVAGMLSFSLITLYLAVMAFSYGEPSQADQFNSYGIYLLCLVVLSTEELGQNSILCLRRITHPYHPTSVDCGFFFLSLATLQIEKIRH